MELYCVIGIKHVVFFTISAKLLVTMKFTFTFPDLRENIGGDVHGLTPDNLIRNLKS